ncbi:type II toxin-antitoxin system VapC family toxin [soil metagenome]
MTGPVAVLDAWALVALLRDEPAAGRVRSTVESGGLVSWMNLGEVLCLEAAHVGTEPALAAVESLAAALVAEEPDAELIVDAAQIKAEHRFSYADAFAAATSIRHRLPLMTGDPDLTGLNHPGFEAIDLRGS